MYPVSSAYVNVMREPSRPYDEVYGTITLTSGVQITLDTSIMPTNSISISRQCIDGGELMFGGVFTDLLKISIITDLSRYVFFGATIELHYRIEVSAGTFETVPLGIFTVADADRPNDRVNLTCYDSMTLLDKEIGGLTISGTPWQVLSEVSHQTGYPLSFTESDLTQFINYDYQLQASEEQGIKTYREVVKEVCQQLGCFACDDRTGRLRLKKFSTNADLTLSYGAWYSIVPADYECNYVALSITSLQGTFTKTNPDPNLVGNIMMIDDAPAFDYGSSSATSAKLDNLFALLEEVDYTPCDIEMPSDASFECGDRLNLNLRDGTTISTLITSLEWKFHQGMTITSEGINPYLEGSSAITTESNRILSQAVERSKLQFVSFTNSAEVVIGDTETKAIGNTSFTPTTETNALFVATILVDADVADITTTRTQEVNVPVKAYNGSQETVVTDLQGNALTLTGTATNTYTDTKLGECTASIYYTLKTGTGSETRVPNDANPYTAIEELTDGRHIITVSYPLTSLTAFERFTFTVYMTVNGGTVTLPAHTLEATILGQEITTLGKFSGEIVVDDTISIIPLYNLGVIKLTDNVTIRMTDPQYDVDETIRDTIDVYDIASLQVLSLSDSVTITMTGRFPLWLEQTDSGTGDNIELWSQDGTRFISE